jgi:hypothetical protein
LMKPGQPLYKKESTQEKERKRNKGQWPKSRQANRPKEAGHKDERELPKDPNPLQSHDLILLNQ